MPKVATLNATSQTVSSPSLPRNFTRITSSMTTITPRQAQILLAQAFPGQRDIKARHVAYLRECLENDEFNPFDPITILYDNRSKQVGLCNGNHRMTLIVTTNQPLRLNVNKIWTDNFDEDFAWLYATFDKSKNRTVGDAIAIFGEHKRLNITPAQAETIARAADIVDRKFAQHQCGVDYSAKSTIRRHGLLVEHGPMGALYLSDIAAARKKVKQALSTQDMTAAAISLYTKHKAAPKLRRFFQTMASGLFSSAGDAAKVLMDEILDDSWGKRKKENKRQIVETMYERWDAGEYCERISFTRSESPISVESRYSRSSLKLQIEI